MVDRAEAIRDRVRVAFESGTPVCIEGGGSKRFFGRAPAGEPLPVGGHRGVVNHEPSELVLTVRAGTPVDETQAALAEHGQWLPFDPPRHGKSSTIGGVVACALSGPTRPWTGAVRDFVLGARIVNGRGDVLSFGGEVMKNVAGYDVSRLMAGALGTLGVLLEVSFKLLPTARMRLDEGLRALPRVKRFDAAPSGHDRPSRSWEPAMTVNASTCDWPGRSPPSPRPRGGSAASPETESCGDDLRDHHHPFFAEEGPPLWRLSVPAHVPPLDLPGLTLIDWGGAQRWVRSDAPDSTLRSATAAAGGHATCFRGGDREQPFHPLAEGLDLLHRRLKAAFDPHHILKPGPPVPRSLVQY